MDIKESNVMNYQTYYLNNSGSRFVLRDKNNRNIKVQLETGEVRRAKYFEQLGNTAFVAVSVKSKLIKTFNYTVIWG